MEVVVAHPNGWGLRQQQFLRTATISAGLAGDDTASSKVRFVTEAEASVHFCIHHANAKNVLKPGTSFGVCDAGGSTVDSTMYMVVSESPLKLKEQRDSGCVQAGAIFVDYEMQKYLESTLREAELDAEDVEFYTKTGVKDFESYAKRTFRSKTAEYAVLVADSRFNKPAIKTRRGRMTVPGSAIQKCFDTCVTQIKQSVDQQMSGLNVPHVLLVGGLGENGYVRNELKKHFELRRSKIILSDESSAKAVADGAVIWGASCSVVSRAPRYSFGIHKKRQYQPLIDDPAGRKAYMTLAGDLRVRGGWSEIVHEGKPIQAGAFYRSNYHRLYDLNKSIPQSFHVRLVTYSDDDTPKWLKDPHGKYLDGFQRVCTLTANLQDAQGAMVMVTNPNGLTYWTLDFTVCICFSGTELESFLEWKENVSGITFVFKGLIYSCMQGAQRTSPVSIVLS
ncbi:putative heat shock 70 kDa protein 12A [Rhizoctonia solani 123E]|uniref:Putative heat shock 70 kDa protein 12A n=1 Tax=Rhizoctonia solani 123E TaxID=1423351 RepID=A0A074RW75_9AGAM|nr:putative heat shock 70 kDa protein 12A [Rhizoctonia solani 123E]